MTKSAMRSILARNAVGLLCQESAIGDMEEAGMTWDPEPEPMAEKLEVRHSGYVPNPFFQIAVPTDHVGGWRHLTLHEATEAVTLYNRRPQIIGVATGLRLAALKNPHGQLSVPAWQLLHWAAGLEGE